MKKHWPLWLLGIGALFAMATGSGDTSRLDRFARAIARAEGFYVPGSRPRRNNNPGNVTDDFGFETTGQDGMFPVFATEAAGWAALKKQLSMAYDGSSRFYHAGMTIKEFARRYTATEQEIWASNVASELGVSVDTPISQV